jgi:hypothetical protein
MVMTRVIVLALLTVAASSAGAAGHGPEEVIRALYKVHRPWEHKELNLSNRAVLSKYFSPELTKLFLKDAQVERDSPEGDLCGIELDPILGSQDFDDDLRSNPRIMQEHRRKLVGSKYISNCLTNYGRKLSEHKN